MKPAALHATILSPAKINLFLRVIKKRDDGYHDIFSLMQPIALYDEIAIRVEDGSGISMECNGLPVPADKTNLAYRAASALLETVGIDRKVSVILMKNIPVAAGLGGGSSNAAAVLKGLNSLLSLKQTDEDLVRIAAVLGSDVPFFIYSRSCLARGRGEVLEPVDFERPWYVLINPGFPVSTQWVYQNLDLTKTTEDINLNVSKKLIKALFLNSGLLVNDLETITIARYPKIREIKDNLISMGAAGALMSGSGPTVFGVFESEDRAATACDTIKKDHRFNGMAVFLARGL